jgi:hypothetical protein
MVHTNPEFETSSLILDFEFDQHLGSHKHVINIIMRFRDIGCYILLFFFILTRGLNQNFLLLALVCFESNILFLRGWDIIVEILDVDILTIHFMIHDP